MILCSQLNKELDRAWGSIQLALQERNEGISQIDLDEVCVFAIEKLAAQLQAENGHPEELNRIAAAAAVA